MSDLTTRVIKHPGLNVERIALEEKRLTELANGLKFLSRPRQDWMEKLLSTYQNTGALNEWEWTKINDMLIIVRQHTNNKVLKTLETKSFKSIAVMLQLVAQDLQRPKIVIANEKGARMRLTYIPKNDSKAFDNFKNKIIVRYGNMDHKISPVNVGCISLTNEGAFQYFKAGLNLKPEVKDDMFILLDKFAKDPAGVAKASAAITGCCCFCNLPLSDPKSKAVGYGKICAERYALPWGGEEKGIAKVYKLRG